MDNDQLCMVSLSTAQNGPEMKILPCPVVRRRRVRDGGVPETEQGAGARGSVLHPSSGRTGRQPPGPAHPPVHRHPSLQQGRPHRRRFPDAARQTHPGRQGTYRMLSIARQTYPGR